MDNKLNTPRIQVEGIKSTAEILGLSVHFVRTAVANGDVVSVRAGRKILVNVDSFRRYLETGIPQGTPPQAASQTETAPRIMPISLC
ncbi:MAG: helix-turn-helix domain-containing protein [Ruminococcaceae bacterium]|nr:helix-turn-helix domain-containing protein [Oscillospiraceae bacterium]